jgi:hypothetical protein
MESNFFTFNEHYDDGVIRSIKVLEVLTPDSSVIASCDTPSDQESLC